jgi:hypothetical protein
MKSADICKQLSEDIGQLLSRGGLVYTGKNGIETLTSHFVDLVEQIKKEIDNNDHIAGENKMVILLRTLCQEYERGHSKRYVIYVGSDILDLLTEYSILDNHRFLFDGHELKLMYDFGITIKEVPAPVIFNELRLAADIPVDVN